MDSPTNAVPARLFKYVSHKRIDVLKNELICFSQPAALNDPWELKPYLETSITPEEYETKVLKSLSDSRTKLVSDSLDRSWDAMTDEQKSKIVGGRQAFKDFGIKHYEQNPQILENIIDGLRSKAPEKIANLNLQGSRLFADQLNNSYGILSLASERDNDLMWAHYAESHTGMVLEFDTNHDFFTRKFAEKDDLSGPKPVLYSSTRPTLSSMDDLTTLAQNGGAKMWEPLMFTKSQSWSYEQEWRMVRLLEGADQIDGAPPKAIHLFNLPASCITGIVLGALMTEKNQQAIIDLLQADSKYEHITLCRAAISDSTFNLDIERLS